MSRDRGKAGVTDDGGVAAGRVVTEFDDRSAHRSLDFNPSENAFGCVHAFAHVDKIGSDLVQLLDRIFDGRRAHTSNFLFCPGDPRLCVADVASQPRIPRALDPDHFVRESLFIYILMLLMETDEATAAIVFATLNTTRARIDLIERLAKIKVGDKKV